MYVQSRQSVRKPSEHRYGKVVLLILQHPFTTYSKSNILIFMSLSLADTTDSPSATPSAESQTHS